MVGAKTARKLRSRSNPESVWFGLGMMGLVGWSVVVPTLLGTALGFWLDRSASGEHSWTIALLFVGLAIGCLNAWYWVAREERAIRDQTRGDDA
jgi:ATP synthase protein I